MKPSKNAYMDIYRADFWSFIIEFTTRNPNLGIPALEDGLFANSLIFDYLYIEGPTNVPSSVSLFLIPPGCADLL